MKSIIFMFLAFLILTLYICESFGKSEKIGNKRPYGSINNKATKKIPRRTTRRPSNKDSSDSESGYESDGGDGTYNEREKGKKNLEKKYKTKINGGTHEAEHVVGYQVLAEDQKGLGVERTNFVGKIIEKAAPAYHEVKELHRDHPGTGSGKKADNYRGLQKGALKEGKIGNAIQINQVEYAQNPKFQEISNKLEGKIATDSFNNMIIKNPEFLEGQHDGTFKSLKMDRGEQIESILSRKLATEGKSFYTQKDVDEIKKKFENEDKKLAKQFFIIDGA